MARIQSTSPSWFSRSGAGAPRQATRSPRYVPSPATPMSMPSRPLSPRRISGITGSAVDPPAIPTGAWWFSAPVSGSSGQRRRRPERSLSHLSGTRSSPQPPPCWAQRRSRRFRQSARTATIGATSANAASTPRCSQRLVALHRDLAIERAHEVGLLDADTEYSAGNYRRDHVVGLDGKVFSSPLRTLDTERVDKATGELRPVRQDTARQRYGEGGVDGIVWGTKFAIASVRSPLANHRVILGISHFDADHGRWRRSGVHRPRPRPRRTAPPGIQAFTADGAWRGTHLNQIQTATGRGVIAPARRRTGRSGGIVIDGHGHAAQPLPWSRRRNSARSRMRRTPALGRRRHPVRADHHRRRRIRVPRADTPPDQTRHHPPQGRQRRPPVLRPLHPPLPRAPDHDWWEPLLATTDDAKTGFNRCEYLRVVPTTGEQHKRLYGMRQDTESLNAQLERAFYGQRLPAWGVHNQTVIVLLAAQAENSWARHVWHHEAEHQRHTRTAA